MRTFIGTAARHIAGIIMAVAFAWLLPTLTNLGVDPDQAVAAVEAVQLIITVAVMLLGYVLTEKGLKVFKSLDPGAWADLVWKRHAAEQVADQPKEHAETLITTGKV